MMKKIFTLIMMFAVLYSSYAQNKNEKEYQYPPFQVTFFPPLGTNGIYSGNAVNKLSFNILAGYSAGLEGLEIGCFLNVENDFVKGIQIAGFSNLVGGNVSAVQIAGFANANWGNAYGSQIAGFANAAIGDLKGSQIAGYANIANGNVDGIQVSGFANVALDSLKGLQIGGFANIAVGPVKGSQISGYANIAIGNLKGVQISGFANITTGNVKGTQISGFANYSRDLKGVQIGFINVAHSADKGLPIGFLSVVKEGLRQFELSGGTTLHTNVAFKTGVDHFYNIFALGVNYKGEDLRWGPGYGIGTLLKFSPSFFGNIELMTYHIVEDWDDSWKGFWDRNDLNLLNQAKFNFVFRANKHFSIFAGAEFNVMVSQYNSGSDNEIGSDIAPWTVYDRTRKDTNVKMWPGFNIGIRIM
ncbi:hypothetical protein ACFLSI_01735 [Bacteroidota bacterium]